MPKLQPGDATAMDLLKRYGVAMRFEPMKDGVAGKWVCGFHFAGPDCLASGSTMEQALRRFIGTVTIEQADVIPE